MSSVPQEFVQKLDERGRGMLETVFELHPRKNDNLVMKELLVKLKKIKSGELQRVKEPDYIYCWIVVENLKNRSRKFKFRVKLQWTGYQTKEEIFNVYEIPIVHQVLIVNARKVADTDTLSEFDFQRKDQIVFLYISKKKIDYKTTTAKLCNILPSEPQKMDINDSAAPETSASANQDGDNDDVTMDADDSDGSGGNETTLPLTADNSKMQRRSPSSSKNKKNRKKRNKKK